MISGGLPSPEFADRAGVKLFGVWTDLLLCLCLVLAFLPQQGAEAAESAILPTAEGSYRLEGPAQASVTEVTRSHEEQVQPQPAQDPELGSFRFALDLFEKGEWQEAVLEFRRFCFLNPGHRLVPHALLYIGRSYEQGERFAEAVKSYQGVVEGYPGEEEVKEARCRVAEALYRAGRFEEAGTFLAGWPVSDTEGPWWWQARYRAAWAALQLHSFTNAKESFAELDTPGSPYREPARTMVSAIEAIQTLPYRSPVLAGFLSGVLPGAGQIYTGAFKDGLLAFAVNAAFIAGSYEAFDKEVYTAGGIASAFGLTFYLGNIYGAVNSAHRANQENLAAHLRPYHEQYEWVAAGSSR